MRLLLSPRRSPCLIFRSRLQRAEELLFGDAAERNVAAGVQLLHLLANVEEHETLGRPGAYANFFLAALASTGVLPEETLRWQPELLGGLETNASSDAAPSDAWLTGPLRAAFGYGLLEARLAVATRTLHVSRDCDAALPSLRALADEVLKEAEAE